MSLGSFLSNKLFETAKPNFDTIKIGIASPEKIESWSFGHVTKPETYNYRTNKPEKDGLLCSVIFGPQKPYECLCGKYRKYKYRGIVCEKCGVEVTHSGVRRDRMGHIKLAFPVLHTWFCYSSPGCVSTLLDIPLKTIEKVIYFESYIVVDPKTSTLEKGVLLSYDEYELAMDEHGEDNFTAMIGAAAIKELLISLNLEFEKRLLVNERAKIKSATRKLAITRRLDLIESFLKSGNKPEHMVIEVLPVIPPDLRPCLMLQDTGKFVSSDLNDLYRRVINRNNRLKNLVDLEAPAIIIRNEQRMLQEAVDALFDNERRAKVAHANGRLYKSLSEVLSGKHGRFRQNLLGKRVDYSGRSVIVVGPTLKLHQCGLPRRMALELFKPFIYSKLILFGKAASIKAARVMVDTRHPDALEVLEEVTKCYPILLNRAPTLHRLGIQAFEPILSNHNAIELHPLVCTAFNADFDGDQMAVHVPLSIEAQTEARILMLASNNIISLSSGEPIITPNQDIILGIYYATNIAIDAPPLKNSEKKSEKVFSSLKEINYALEIEKEISIHSQIKYFNIIRDLQGNVIEAKAYETCAGRVKLYKLLPENQAKISFDYFNHVFTKKDVHTLLDKAYDNFPVETVAKFADDLMQFGFKVATQAGVSIGKDDIIVPPTKPERIRETIEKVNVFEKQYHDSFITEKEKYHKTTDAWQECANQVTEDMIVGFKDKSDTTAINSIYMIAHSGARGSITQIKQLAGMRGLIVKTSGDIMETPIISNFKEGLKISEYFNSAHGARKGLADTALKTADAGYLTRRLVDVSQNCVVTQEDCEVKEGITFTSRFEKNRIVKHVSKIAFGRIPAHDIMAENGDIILPKNTLISKEGAELIEKHNIHEIELRSVVKCQTEIGVCAKCYGADIVTRKLVEIGQPIGIIAAQSIGEPGTQLTMRTFQVGGVAFKSVDKPFINAEEEGVVTFFNLSCITNKKGVKIIVSNNALLSLTMKSGKVQKYPIPYGSRLSCDDGEAVAKNQRLADIEVHTTPIISEFKGKISSFDLISGISYKETTNEETGNTEKTIIESNLHPGIRLLDEGGEIIKNVGGNLLTYYFPVGASVLVSEGQEVEVGDVLARLTKSAQKSRDITGGLPRVVDLFEARKPKKPEIISPTDGYIIDIKSYKTKKKIVISTTEKNAVPTDAERKNNILEFPVSGESMIVVHSGSKIYKGDTIVEGEKNPYDILKIGGVDKLVEYILSEIQAVYELQGVKINDKHIEIIVKYMLKKVKVVDEKDSYLAKEQVLTLPNFLIAKQNTKKYHLLFKGIRAIITYIVDNVSMAEEFKEIAENSILSDSSIVSTLDLLQIAETLVKELNLPASELMNDINLNNTIKSIMQPIISAVQDVTNIILNEKDYTNDVTLSDIKKIFKEFSQESAMPVIEPILQGITRASLETESFISAASFQETAKILTFAAIAGKRDKLVGIKENVVVGKLIPAGTGLALPRIVKVVEAQKLEKASESLA